MRSEEKEEKKNYGIMAKYYHNWRTKANPKGWFYNEYMEMPATLDLLGNVKGKKILDHGCGTGLYLKHLKKKGAKIKGFDLTPEMVEIAKKENPNIDLKLGSAYKIPFKEKFDIVVSSLVFPHLKNWDLALKEIKRVLKKKGTLIFSIANPVLDRARVLKISNKTINKKGIIQREIRDYFKEGKIYARWKNSGGDVMMPSFHKTYESIIKILIKNGFEILDYSDAKPMKKAEKLFPNEYKIFSQTPNFCVWKVKLKK